VIWAGFAGLGFASFMSAVVVALPPAPLAFYGAGVIPDDRLPQVMFAQFVVKVGVEVVFTPVTYKIVGWLKRAEHEDYFDHHTDFNPFTLKP